MQNENEAGDPGETAKFLPSGAATCSPCMVDIKRHEDMGGGSLLLFKQEDGDWIIRLVGRNIAGNLTTGSIEFCTPMTGGGASPKTWAALENLAQAMMEDNAAPSRFGLRAEHSEANVERTRGGGGL